MPALMTVANWFSRQMSELQTERGSRPLHFIFHTVVFLPVIVTACAAWALGVKSENIFFFVTFAITAISMEICWNCILVSVESILRLGRLARAAASARHPKTKELEVMLGRSRLHTAICILCTIATLIGWTLVVCCEILHMEPGAGTLNSQHVTTDGADEPKSEDLASDHKNETSSSADRHRILVTLAALMAFFNLALSLWKLWASTEKADEKLVDELALEFLRDEPEDGAPKVHSEWKESSHAR